MVIHVKLKSLQASFILILSIEITSAFGQSVATDTLHFKSNITAFSQDRTGNIFLSFEGGAITKYSPSLGSLISFSPAKLGDITLLEAWHGFQIFAFYEEFQEFILLDRFLTRDTRYPLSESAAIYADICTISSDQNLWVFEENQLRLLKVNLNIREIETESPLEFIIDTSEHNITFIREYQNLLFLVDELSGIYVFDNLGNYLRRIDAPGILNCSFQKDRLFYLKENEVHSINLYKGDHKIILTTTSDSQGVIPLSNSLLVIKRDMIIEYPMSTK